jgi:uncharacterized membrane protein YccC
MGFFRRRGGKDRASRTKSKAEVRFERYTWIALVAVFGALYTFPDLGAAPAANYLIPGIVAIIALGSGFLQYFRGWSTSPVLWIVGVLCGAIAFFVWNYNPAFNPAAIVLLMVAGVIVFGILSGDT